MSVRASESPQFLAHAWITILAGGVGSRFWPASTPEAPKPLLNLASDRPLLQDTLERAQALAPAERISILAGPHLVGPFSRAIPSLTSASFWVEPAARGTAPVLTWAAWKAVQHDPDAVLVSLHSDHVIDPTAAFVERVNTAIDVAQNEGMLVTIGAVPDRPEIGYGYLQPGEPLPTSPAARRVAAFHEKPDAETAERYLEDGFLWNTGIFIWRASVLLEEVRAHAPEIEPALHHLEAGNEDAFFAEVKPVSIDVAVLERSSRVACLASTFRWDDVGTWDALSRTRPTDAQGNVVAGAGHVVEGHDNIIWSDDERLIVWGLDDVVAVRANGVTVVFPKHRAPELKTLLNALDSDEATR